MRREGPEGLVGGFSGLLFCECVARVRRVVSGEPCRETRAGRARTRWEQREQRKGWGAGRNGSGVVGRTEEARDPRGWLEASRACCFVSEWRRRDVW